MIYCFVYLLLSYSGLMAQQPYTRQQAVKDGLPSMTVYDIFQDSKDYIWMGTDKGLCRYDGQGFQYYYNENQKGTAIDGLKEDSKGHIWCKNFQNQIFYVARDSLIELEKPSDFDGSISQFDIIENNKIWIAATTRLYLYDIEQKKWDKIPLLEDKNKKRGTKAISFVQVKDKEEVWVGPMYSNIWLINKKRIFQEPICPSCSKAPEFISDRADQCPLVPYGTKNGKSYFVEYCNQPSKTIFSVFVLENDTIQKLASISPYLKNENVISLMVDDDEYLWISLYNGILIFKKENNNYTFSNHIFKEDAISKVIEDREGNYWCTTLDNGIYFIPAREMRHLKTSSIPGWPLQLEKLVIQDSIHLILGGKKQYHEVFNILNHQFVHTYNTMSSRRNESMFFDQATQKLYIQQGGLTIFDKGANFSNFKELRFQNIKDFESISAKYLLIGTRTFAGIMKKGLLKSPLNEWPIADVVKAKKSTISNCWNLYIRFCLNSDSLENACNAVYAESITRYWLGYTDTLRLFDNGEIRSILDEEGKSFSARDIDRTSDGIIWVATSSSGIIGLNKGQIISHFKQDKGLVSNNILCLKVDGNGLWVGTNKGLQYLDVDHKSIRTYDQSDGLASNEINDIEILGGKVWLATNEGLIFFDKNMPSTNSYAPPIYLSGIAINGEDTLLSTKYELPYHRNNFFIRFQGIAYRSQGNFTYKYRMQGLSEDWVTVNSAQNELRFMSLNPGEYHLEIYALNEDGVESKKPIIIDFLIHPPYWQTWWFWSLIGGGLLLIAGGITYWQFTVYRRRQALILQMQQLRTQALQSQMNPHFIFNAMNAIQKLMVKDTMENALGYMAKFAKLIRMIFEISGQQSIPLEEEISFLKLYLDLEKLRFKDKVTIEFQIDEALLDDFYFIPPLLIQPIIENSFKHGLMHKETPGYLKIEFKKENGYLYVCVEDNGVGRKRAAELSEWKQEKRTKTGLIVTKERLSMLTAHPNHPQNFLITDLSDENGLAVGLRTELWISFSLENGDNES